MVQVLPFSISMTKINQSPEITLSKLEIELENNIDYILNVNREKKIIKYHLNYDKSKRGKEKIQNIVKIQKFDNNTFIFSFHYGNKVFLGTLFFLLVPFALFIYFMANGYKTFLLAIYPFLLYVFYLNSNGLGDSKKQITEIINKIKNSS